MNTKVFPFKLQHSVIENSYLCLEPLQEDHIGELVTLFDPDIWRWYTVDMRDQNVFREFMTKILDEQTKEQSYGFAIRDKLTGTLVGSSKFMNLQAHNRKLEIGSTWFAPKWQRTYANTETKILMLSFAFEELSCISVNFQTDSLNTRSRAAIERLGAKLDGIIRNDRICDDGRIRHSAYYTITCDEWPAVKETLIKKRAR